MIIEYSNENDWQIQHLMLGPGVVTPGKGRVLEYSNDNDWQIQHLMLGPGVVTSGKGGPYDSKNLQRIGHLATAAHTIKKRSHAGTRESLSA